LLLILLLLAKFCACAKPAFLKWKAACQM